MARQEQRFIIASWVVAAFGALVMPFGAYLDVDFIVGMGAGFLGAGLIILEER